MSDKQQIKEMAQENVRATGRALEHLRLPHNPDFYYAGNTFNLALDVIKELESARDAERYLWEKRANALLEIAKAATAIVEAPYLIRDRGNYLITQTEFEALKRAVEECKSLSEAEVQK